MSVLLLAAIALPGGLATALLAGRRRQAFVIGLLSALACVGLALSIRAEDTVPLAGSIIGGSDALRTVTVAWAISTLLFGLMDGLLGDGPAVLGPSLVGLGVGAVGLAVADAGIGFASLTTGAIVSAVLPIVMVRGGPAAAPGLGVRSLRPILVAGVISLMAVAWSASPVGPFAAIGPLGDIDPALETGMGVALVAVAGAVLIRLGAIPAHIWAARFSEAMPASAVPPVLGWSAAGFTLVALGWVDVTVATTGATLGPERAIIAFAAAASIVLGGVAAILHDDIEHVLVYSMVQDAGVALLAFGATSGAASDAGRTWIVAAVAIKSGLAAWVLVTRATFGVHRRLDLPGWARRSPILGATLVVVLLAAVGLPGMANFEARGTLIRLAMPGQVGVLVLIAAFAPIVYLGRLLLAGIEAMTEPVRLAVRAVPRLRAGRDGGWALDASPARAVPALIRANRLPLAAATALLVAVVGLAVATGGLGSTQVGELPGGGGQAPSGEPPGPSGSPSAPSGSPTTPSASGGVSD